MDIEKMDGKNCDEIVRLWNVGVYDRNNDRFYNDRKIY